jgi:hypothetical protein
MKRIIHLVMESVEDAERVDILVAKHAPGLTRNPGDRFFQMAGGCWDDYPELLEALRESGLKWVAEQESVAEPGHKLTDTENDEGTEKYFREK